MTSSALTAERRTTELATVGDTTVDLLVVGLGVTGAGVALDAASRGLSVVAVDAHDLAFGTSRWSSKLVHGGLRYLAQGQLGVAHESAVERGILMTTTAPHLTRAMPMVVPLTPAVSRPQGVLVMQGLRAGDALRAAARTPRSLLPRPRRLSPEETIGLVPTVSREGLRGGLLSSDGQLEDDARLVVALARTAASYGARVLIRTRALDVTGDGATLRDELTGSTTAVRARAVVNAAGVWAGQVVPGLTLRPSRGTHLVLRGASLPGTDVAVSAPVPGSSNRFVLTLPQPDGLVFLGLTDEPVEGDIPDVPSAEESEVDFLLATVNSAFRTPLTRDDVVGTYSGLRPLLAPPDGAEGASADLSRRHAVLASDTGVVTVVGGKLTTYRRMAEDAVDAAVRRRGLRAGPCRTRNLPLVGATPRGSLAAVDAPARLVRRYGAEAPLVLDAARQTGRSDEELLAPVAPGVPVARAELLWGVTHEGALDVEDLLDRRTRVGLVATDRALADAAAREALEG
ncbi:MAG TPA: glycerol-3-phosphate dehydrogenase/oxidase [Marmoricola sp.]|nr:glycerol-3-phosphate dehydrogenase/oxidase [Marmoricola sp.]